MTDRENPANPTDEVARILQAHRDEGGTWPAGMPIDVETAAKWFLAMIEPVNDQRERPRQVNVIGGGTRTVYPYLERVRHCLHRFLRADRDFQRYVHSASEDGVYWRGEDQRMFRTVVDETLVMREIGTEEYRNRTRSTARRAMAGLKGDHQCR